jgi:small subunit ribosomal protein S19e
MATSYDVPTNDLLERTAQKLKAVSDIKPPEWATFIKTGVHKERPPVSNDWWYMRAAAILRSVYNLGPIGVSKLRTKYGGNKNRGHKPGKFYKGSGSIVRKCLQQLTNAGLLVDKEKNGRKGKVITPKGASLLDKTAGEIYKEIKAKKRVAPKPEPKPQVKEEKKEAPKAEEKKEEVKEAPKKEAKPVEKKEEAPKEEKIEVQEEKVKNE